MELSKFAFTIKTRTARRASGGFYRELQDQQHLPLQELTYLQNRRAAAIAEFAAANTDFYRRLFAESQVAVDKLQDLDQWQRIPIITRGTVKKWAAEISSTESTRKTAREAKTGGSTGEPLRTQVDARVPLLAAAWRMYGWWGVEPWDNLARVGRWSFGRSDNARNYLNWWPSRQVYLDATLFNDETMRKFHRQVVRTRPALIEGYVGAMTEFANFLDSEKLSIPAPVAVATTAAPLTQNVRQHLERVLGAPVYDEYRGSEINWLAGECAQQHGLHVFSDLRKVEVVDDLGRVVPHGTVGDLVVTDLTNRVFPLIRYRTGDRGTLLDRICECGVTLPLMAQPEGRTTDVIRTPSGNALNHGLMAMFGTCPESVRLFQIHQHHDYSITIRVVRGEDLHAEANIDSAVAVLRRRMNDEVPIFLEYVDRLPYSGGKTKYVISDIPN